MMNWMSVDPAQFYDGVSRNEERKSDVKHRNICQSITTDREKHNSAVQLNSIRNGMKVVEWIERA